MPAHQRCPRGSVEAPGLRALSPGHSSHAALAGWSSVTSSSFSHLGNLTAAVSGEMCKHTYPPCTLSKRDCPQCLGGQRHGGQGWMPGMQICTRAVICTNVPWCAHSQPVPGTRSARKAGRELFAALDGERGAGLCSHPGTALQGRCLALLTGVQPILPRRSFKALKAFAEWPAACLWDWLASLVEPAPSGGRRCLSTVCPASRRISLKC